MFWIISSATIWTFHRFGRGSDGSRCVDHLAFFVNSNLFYDCWWKVWTPYFCSRSPFPTVDCDTFTFLCGWCHAFFFPNISVNSFSLLSYSVSVCYASGFFLFQYIPNVILFKACASAMPLTDFLSFLSFKLARFSSIDSSLIILLACFIHPSQVKLTWATRNTWQTCVPIFMITRWIQTKATML